MVGFGCGRALRGKGQSRKGGLELCLPSRELHKKSQWDLHNSLRHRDNCCYVNTAIDRSPRSQETSRVSYFDDDGDDSVE